MADLKKPYNDVHGSLAEIEQAKKRAFAAIDDAAVRAAQNANDVIAALETQAGKTATDLMRDSVIALGASFVIQGGTEYAPYLHTGRVTLTLEGRNGAGHCVLLRGSDGGGPTYVGDPGAVPKLKLGKYRVLVFVLPEKA